MLLIVAFNIILKPFEQKICPVMPSKDTPGKSGRPHLGRAFTDVQELKQVS